LRWPLTEIRSHVQVFLCQRGINHWGSRVIVDTYEAHDVTRGITIFGVFVLNNAIINRRSENNKSGFPGAPFPCF
jgi:hypothetical protein